MYRIKDEYGNILEETITPRWVKQQKHVDLPINADSYEEANGIVLSDEKFYGIYKVDEETGESVVPNMNDYPQVTIEEVSSDPYIFQRMSDLETQIKVTQDGISQVYDAQTVGMVSKTELDEAYREGVNSVG